MGDLLRELIPQGRRGLGLWFILFIVSFGGYHFWGPYSVFEQWYYNVERQPERDEDVVTQQTDIAVAHIRIQRPVADFLESEVVITVQNMTTKTQTAVVGLEIGVNATQTAPKTPPRVYIHTPLTTRTQDVIFLEDIPPYGKVSAVFLVRIANGEKGCEYPLEFIINDKYIPHTNIAFEYNPHERLRMWLVSLLLLPPGSSIALPVLTMLFVSWLESLSTVLKYKQFGKDLVQGDVWRIFTYTWAWLSMMLFFSIVLRIALPQKLSGSCHIIRTFIVGSLCCFLPPVYNWLGSESGQLLIAKTNLPKGYQLKKDDLDKKAEDKIGLLSAEQINHIIGRKLKCNIESNRPILESDLE